MRFPCVSLGTIGDEAFDAQRLIVRPLALRQSSNQRSLRVYHKVLRNQPFCCRAMRAACRREPRRAASCSATVLL